VAACECIHRSPAVRASGPERAENRGFPRIGPLCCGMPPSDALPLAAGYVRVLVWCKAWIESDAKSCWGSVQDFVGS
jgi:hypothetical protein